MAAISDYLEQALLNHVFRGIAYTAPTNVYIALFTSATDDAAGGTEVSGGAYARVAVAATTAQWNAPGVGGLIDNINAITFPTATANWGTITHVAVFDAASGGNRLFHGALTASQVVNTDSTFRFNAGDLDLTLA